MNTQSGDGGFGDRRGKPHATPSCSRPLRIDVRSQVKSEAAEKELAKKNKGQRVQREGMNRQGGVKKVRHLRHHFEPFSAHISAA